MILELRAGAASFLRPPGLRCPERQVLAGLAILIAAAWAMIALMASREMAMDVRTMPASSPPRVAMPGTTNLPIIPAKWTTLSIRGVDTWNGSTPASLYQWNFGLSLSSGGMWALMIVAVMLPSALPAAAYAGAHSLRWRRRRTMVQFVLGYGAVWLAMGALVLAATVRLQAFAGALWVAICVAAAWQLMPLKRRALRDCHRPVPLPQYGGAAPRAAMIFGVRNGWACVRSCWAMMVVMTLIPALQLESMAVTAVLVASEKLALHPRRASRQVAALLGGVAAVAATVAIT